MHQHPMGQHGMLVLGKNDDIYLLHLAMRSSSNPAHAFQLILKADLQADDETTIGDRSFIEDGITLNDTGANQVYFLDRNHPENNVPVYTFRPGETFPLIEVITGERTSFRGDIVRGHFEREFDTAPDTLTNVVAVVKEILFVQHLQPPAFDVAHPLDNGELEFLLFGFGNEFFISHKITQHEAPTDNAFHQVFEVQESTAERLNFDLTRKAVLVLIEGIHATEAGRLPEAGGIFLSQIMELVVGGEGSLPIELEVGPEHYLEILM